MRFLIGVSGALLFAACAGSDRALPLELQQASANRAVAAQLNGTWVEQNLVIGSAFVLQFTAQDTIVTGTGTYAIEAGRSGTLTVSGVVHDQQRLHLDIVYDYGPQSQFDGSLADQNALKGVLHYGPPSALSPSYAATFSRKP